MSTCHAGEEFAKAGTTFQQLGQATCQNYWEKNGAQYRKSLIKPMFLLMGENMY